MKYDIKIDMIFMVVSNHSEFKIFINVLDNNLT